MMMHLHDVIQKIKDSLTWPSEEDVVNGAESAEMNPQHGLISNLCNFSGDKLYEFFHRTCKRESGWKEWKIAASLQAPILQQKIFLLVSRNRRPLPLTQNHLQCVFHAIADISFEF